MKYNVGDTVKILPRFLLVEYFDWIKLTEKDYTANVVPGMYRHAEKVATITRASDRSVSWASDLYHIDIDEECYSWEDIMFERTEPLFDGDPVPSLVLLRDMSMEGVDELI